MKGRERDRDREPEKGGVGLQVVFGSRKGKVVGHELLAV